MHRPYYQSFRQVELRFLARSQRSRLEPAHFVGRLSTARKRERRRQLNR